MISLVKNATTYHGVVCLRNRKGRFMRHPSNYVLLSLFGFVIRIKKVI